MVPNTILLILGKHHNGGNVDEDNLDDTTPYADFSVPDLFNHVSNNNGYPRQYHQSKLGKHNFIYTETPDVEGQGGHVPPQVLGIL
jgi:hypothetical protein